MDEVRSAMEDHMNQIADLVQKLSDELRSGFAPAYDNFMGFFHAIDWKLVIGAVVDGIIGILCVSVANYYLLQETCQLPNVPIPSCLHHAAVSGVYLAERLNRFLGAHWESFATQNYFDPQGLFLSVLWSGPLLVIAMLILINTLFSLCHLIVRWKRAELRHRARLEKKEN
uniref:Transmembrane protein 18 n=1 Tax=Chenopodium quinoa TaxID=63459 RepID=A0A803L053_CHEQI